MTQTGVNYKAAQSNWATDFSYFKQNNIFVRPQIPNAPIPWSAGSSGVIGSNAYWRLCATTSMATNLYTTWGYSVPTGSGPYRGGGLTATLYASYHDAVIAEASYLQSQNISFGDFNIGNEMEAFVDGTTLTITTLRNNLIQLAKDVKAVYSLSPISYSCNNFNGTNWSAWVSLGLGTNAIDLLSLHPYGTVVTQQGYSYWTPSDFSGPLQTTIAAFGSKCYISEFNLDSNATNILLLTTEQAVTATRQMWSVIKSTGVSMAAVYMWCQFLNNNPSDQGFVMQNTDGSFNPVFDVLLGNDRRTFQP